MGKLITLINDVDVSAHFVALQGLESTGPDVIGSANLLLRKTGGLLDILPGMTVEVYEAFNDAGAGVKDRGRYFMGFVASVDSLGEVSSTFYTVNCVDNNVLLDAIVESVTNTLVVEADTFADQILDIVTTKTGVGGFKTRDIDAVSRVANLTGATVLPAIEFSHGETLREMIQKVCDNAVLADPTIRPRFFMHVDTTFGIGDSVGAAVLDIYDAALTPAASFHFKSTALVNSGSDRPIYGQFQYKLDAAPSLITKIQSYWHGTDTASEEDAAAIAATPNPYLSSGAWLAKALVDTVSTTQAEADAQLQAILAQTATPRRSILFTSRQLVRPGEVVDVTWPMQGIAGESYRVAGVSVVIPDGNGDVFCNITLDRMEMELGMSYVINSAITTTGGGTGGGPPVFGLTNPWDMETNTWALTDAANTTRTTFGVQGYGSPTFKTTDYGGSTVGLTADGFQTTGNAGGTYTVRGFDTSGWYQGDNPFELIWGMTAGAHTSPASSGDVDWIRVIETQTNHTGTGTVADLAGLYVTTPAAEDGPVTTAYGLYVEDQDAASIDTAYAAYLNGATHITDDTTNIADRVQALTVEGHEATGGPANTVRAINASGNYEGDNDQHRVWGIVSAGRVTAGSSGDVNSVRALEGYIAHDGSGTVDHSAGLYIGGTGTGPITTAYGIYVEDQATSVNTGTAWAAYFNGNVNITGDLTVGGSGGGGSAHTIEDEGAPLTARTKLNFVGAGVTVTDDAGDDASVVTIPGGGSVGELFKVTFNWGGDVVLTADSTIVTARI